MTAATISSTCNLWLMNFFRQFIMTAVSVALPIPAGVFFPVFLIGRKNTSYHNFIVVNNFDLYSCIVTL